MRTTPDVGKVAGVHSHRQDLTFARLPWLPLLNRSHRNATPVLKQNMRFPRKERGVPDGPSRY